MGALLPFALFGFALASVAFGAGGLRLMMDNRRLDLRLAAVVGQAPDAAGFRLPGIGLAEGRDRAEIERQLRNAGLYEPGAVEQFVWIRLAVTLVAALGSLALTFLFSFNIAIKILIVFSITGLSYIGAKLALQLRAGKRERRLTAEFPFLLDLILMMLESGISLDQCFRTIASEEQVAVPEHSQLIGTLVADLDRGLDYQAAFDRWASRVGLMGARELASLFRQSLFKGMELVPALREFITEFSQRRVARARESIGKITVRMVVLMLVFFMPALLIVLAGPPVAAILDTLVGAKP
ncbi:MAG: type II secretion system F family protein [Novosphingobium sp.]|nr:type II secretion system F family protein [Novosphingobium sp.]